MRVGGIHIYSKQPVKEVIELVIIGNVKDRWEAKDVEKYFKQKLFSWWFDLLWRGGFWEVMFYFFWEKGKQHASWEVPNPRKNLDFSFMYQYNLDRE